MLKKLTIGIIITTALAISSYAADDCAKYLKKGDSALSNSNYQMENVSEEDYRETAIAYNTHATANYLRYQICMNKKKGK